MNLAAYSLHKRTIAWLAALVVLVGGWIGYQQLGRFEDPEFVIRQAVVVTPYPGALPIQVAEEVTDGILVRLQRDEERTRAAIAVVQATQWPLLGGTAVGIRAFSAMGLSPTDMGEHAGSLSWVILYAMLLSWLIAVTLTPLLCVSFLAVKPLAADAGLGPVPRRYRGLLGLVLRRRALTGAALILLLVAAVGGFGLVPPGFMPESARPQFVVDLYAVLFRIRGDALG
jgi:multidrug efflux pump subunit AcrB